MRVQLKDPNSGEIYSVDADQAPAAQRKHGLVPATVEDVKAFQLQEVHGGQKLQTAAEGFAREGAGFIGGFAASPGMPGAPPTAPISPVAVQDAVFPVTPERAARAEANPVSASLGKAAAELPAYAALGSVSAGAGAAVAEGLGASAALGAGAGLFTESAVTGAAQAAQEGNLTAETVAKNGLINLALGSVLPAAGAIYRKAFAVRPIEQAVQNTIRRAGAAAENLADPEVATAARTAVQTKVDDTISKLTEAIDASRTPVTNNPQAQRDALEAVGESLREEAPNVAAELDAARVLPRERRYRALVELAQQDHPPETQQALADLVSNRALWGDKAVEHTNAVQAARSPGAKPSALADAARSIDDEGVQRLVSDLDAHLQDSSRLDGAQAFGVAEAKRARRSVGAMGDEPDLSPEQVTTLLREKDQVIDALQTRAGGGRGEKGVFQEFNDSFRESMNNRVKREDFAKVEEHLDPEVRQHLNGESSSIAEQVEDIAKQLDDRKAKKSAELLRTHLRALEGGEAGTTGTLDRLKQAMDNLHLKAMSDTTDPYNEMVASIDPVVDRIRSVLQNPEYVGEQIAEHQRVRNLAWSDKTTGFLRNMQIARKEGADFLSKVDIDYNTGDIVLDFDAGSFKTFLGKDVHEAKRALEAWGHVLDSAEKMALNTVEVGAPSAGRTPLVQLQQSINGIRDIFKLRAALHEAERRGAGGVSALQRAESVPVAGKVVTAAKALVGKATVEAHAAGQASRFAGKADRTALSASAAMKRYLGPLAVAGLATAGVLGSSGAANAAELDPDGQHAVYLAQDAEQDTIATARALSDPAYAAEYTRRTKGAPSTLDQFQGEHATIQQAFMTQRAAVDRMMRDPDAVIDALGEAFGGLSPALRDALGSKAMQIASYLHAELPPQRGVSVTRPNGLPPSTLEARSYALKYMTALDPSTAFDDAKRGQLRHEQVDTLKATWPELYADLRSQTLVEMGNGRSTVVQRQRADLLFGFGAAIDAAFSPSLSAAAAAARQKQAQVPTSSSAPEKTRIPAGLTPGGIKALNLGASP